jgi:hypothetical protein
VRSCVPWHALVTRRARRSERVAVAAAAVLGNGEIRQRGRLVRSGKRFAQKMIFQVVADCALALLFPIGPSSGCEHGAGPARVHSVTRDVQIGIYYARGIPRM